MLFQFCVFRRRGYFKSMKVTVEISKEDMRDMMRLSGEKRRGAALTKFLTSSLMLSRRRELLDKFATGEWSSEGPSGHEMKSEWVQP
jgi:hypothetical protein